MSGAQRMKIMQIYKAMAGVMADMEAIGKDKRNQQQGFNYRGIDDVYNVLHPLLAKHKIFTTPEVLERWREERTNNKGTILAFVSLQMKYTFWCEDGSSVSCVVIGEGMDSGDKATNKAMAIAHKYALLQTFAIPTADMVDPDSECHELQAETEPQLIGKKDIEKIRAMMKETDTDESAFCQWLKVEKLEDIWVQNLNGVLQALQKKKAAMNKQPSRLNQIMEQQGARQ